MRASDLDRASIVAYLGAHATIINSLGLAIIHGLHIIFATLGLITRAGDADVMFAGEADSLPEHLRALDDRRYPNR